MHKRNQEIFGGVTPHMMGFFIRSLMRKAINLIDTERFVMEVEDKRGKTGKMDDKVTSGDRKAQKLYSEYFKEALPLIGLIGEERGLRIPCRIPGHDVYITIDPLDGTKAYVRRQSTGISTMLALVVDDKVVCAYVGDINTGELFGFRPFSKKVYRLYKDGLGTETRLIINPNKSLKEQYIYLRDNALDHSALVRQLTEPSQAFKGVEINGGSIGITFSRLWKGEVGAVVLKPTHNTPWDSTPVWGISQLMGFKFFRIKTDKDRMTDYLEKFTPYPERKITHEPCEVLVIHKSRIKELKRLIPRTIFYKESDALYDHTYPAHPMQKSTTKKLNKALYG